MTKKIKRRLVNLTLEERCLSFFASFPSKRVVTREVYAFIKERIRSSVEDCPTVGGVRTALNRLVKEGKLKSEKVEGLVFYSTCERMVKTDPIFYTVDKSKLYSKYNPSIRRRMERILLDLRHTPPTYKEIATKLEEGRASTEDPFKRSSISKWLQKLERNHGEIIVDRSSGVSKTYRYIPTKKLLNMEEFVKTTNYDPKDDEDYILDEVEEQIEEEPAKETPIFTEAVISALLERVKGIKHRLLEEALFIEELENTLVLLRGK